MRKILLGLALAAALPAAEGKPPAGPLPKAPSAAVISHAGDICKGYGGFGRVFVRGYGQVTATASDDWAPFERLTIEAGRISAEASFRGLGDSAEEDAIKAEKFLKALDKAVVAKGRFKHHETDANAMRFSSGKEPGTGIVLELHQEADTIVATCSGS